MAHLMFSLYTLLIAILAPLVVFVMQLLDI
jgi:hypothetical protein